MTPAAQRTGLGIVAALLMVTAWWLVGSRDDVAPRSAAIDPSPIPASARPAPEAPVAAELQDERQPGTSLELPGPTATGTHRADQPPGPSAQRTGGKVAPTTRAQREYFANTILASHGTTVVANIVEETRREWRAKLASAGANVDEAAALVEEYAQAQLQYWLAFYAAMDRYVRNEPDLRHPTGDGAKATAGVMTHGLEPWSADVWDGARTVEFAYRLSDIEYPSLAAARDRLSELRRRLRRLGVQ